MRIERLSVHVLDVHCTIDGLRGGRKNEAPFAFLAAKTPYNYTYRRLFEERPVLTMADPAGVRVESVCRQLSTEKNFWCGARTSARARYDGFIGRQPVAQVAWDRFVPFKVTLPSRLAPKNAAGPWESPTAGLHLWSCGWAVSARLTTARSLDLDELMALMTGLRDELFTIDLGDETIAAPLAGVLAGVSRWTHRKIFQPIFQDPIAEPPRLGPFTFIAVERGSEGPASPAGLDEAAQRRIYGVTSQDANWSSYGLDKIRAAFKPLDAYPGSFIFMDRFGRFFWFPALMTAGAPHSALTCYLQNTTAATMMMAMLSEFVGRVTDLQAGGTGSLNWPLRSLYRSAAGTLAAFPTFYRNTNLKRLAIDLEVTRRLTEAAPYLA